jgi:hydrogenase nickel incorporation protein HypA/HybF
MHEASIAQGIIETVQQLRADGTASGRLLKVFIRVGRLTAVIPDNLCFLYGVMVEETELAGSSLEIEMIPISGRCRACGEQFEIDEPSFLCRHCRSPEVEILSGRELEIAALEVE